MQFPRLGCTLTAFKEQINFSSSSNTNETKAFIRYIAAATSVVESYCNRKFLPVLQAKAYDAAGDHVSPYQLDLDDDLLALTSVLNGDSVSYGASSFSLRPTTNSVKHAIKFKQSAGATFTYETDHEEAITVTGKWGYHDDWDNAWYDTGIAKSGSPTSNADGTISIVLNTFSNSFLFGADLFQEGQYIKSDDEILLVTDVDDDTDTLIALPAQLGTSAGTRTSSFSIFSHVQSVSTATLRLAVWLYRKRDDMGSRIQQPSGQTIITSEAPPDIWAVLDQFIRYSLSN